MIDVKNIPRTPFEAYMNDGFNEVMVVNVVKAVRTDKMTIVDFPERGYYKVRLKDLHLTYKACAAEIGRGLEEAANDLQKEIRAIEARLRELHRHPHWEAHRK